MDLPGETEAGSAWRQPCRGITGGLIEPMFSSAGVNPLALCIAWRKPSDNRPHALKNPRPAGAESTLTENASSPFHAEQNNPTSNLRKLDALTNVGVTRWQFFRKTTPVLRSCPTSRRKHGRGKA